MPMSVRSTYARRSAMDCIHVWRCLLWYWGEQKIETEDVSGFVRKDAKDEPLLNHIARGAEFSEHFLRIWRDLRDLRDLEVIEILLSIAYYERITDELQEYNR